MADVNFIEFGTTPYFMERESVYTDHYKVRGVQLLPNNPYPYIQTTNVSGGIELEDWEVFIVDVCGNETDVTAYFSVDRIFADDNGYNQFDWSLTNVPFDFGWDLVYLKATQLIGETFYSNYFMLTDSYGERTSRIDYKSHNMPTMQSIQVQLGFRQELKEQELTNYYETSTRNTVTNVVKSQRYENWLTELISNDLFLKLSDVFEYKFVYVDLLRCNLFKAVEVKEYAADENFADNIVKLAFNKSDVYDPLAVAVVAPSIPSITLSSVVANGLSAIYTFTYANFSPTYLIFEYSTDQVNWTQSTSGITSPRNVAFNGTGTWYFRITHPEAISNVIMLNLGEAVVANDDYREIAKGGIIDILVLANDTLVGTTIITGVTSPINGTAVAINGNTQIRYTHNDSATASDSFDYTIGNGLTSDSATVFLNITTTSFSNGTSVSHGHALPAADPDFTEITGTLKVTATKNYKVTIKNQFNYANKATGYLSITGIGSIDAKSKNDASTIESNGTLTVPAGEYVYTLRATLDIIAGLTAGAVTATIIEI